MSPVSYLNQSLYLSGLEVKGTGLQSKLYIRSQKHNYKCQHWSLNSFFFFFYIALPKGKG